MGYRGAGGVCRRRRSTGACWSVDQHGVSRGRSYTHRPSLTSGRKKMNSSTSVIIVRLLPQIFSSTSSAPECPGNTRRTEKTGRLNSSLMCSCMMPAGYQLRAHACVRNGATLTSVQRRAIRGTQRLGGWFFVCRGQRFGSAGLTRCE